MIGMILVGVGTFAVTVGTVWGMLLRLKKEAEEEAMKMAQLTTSLIPIKEVAETIVTEAEVVEVEDTEPTIKELWEAVQSSRPHAALKEVVERSSVEVGNVGAVLALMTQTFSNGKTVKGA